MAAFIFLLNPTLLWAATRSGWARYKRTKFLNHYQLEYASMLYLLLFTKAMSAAIVPPLATVTFNRVSVRRRNAFIPSRQYFIAGCCHRCQFGINPLYGSAFAHRTSCVVGLEPIQALLVALLQSWTFGTFADQTSLVIFQIPVCTLPESVIMSRFAFSYYLSQLSLVKAVQERSPELSGMRHLHS